MFVRAFPYLFAGLIMGLIVGVGASQGPDWLTIGLSLPIGGATYLMGRAFVGNPIG